METIITLVVLGLIRAAIVGLWIIAARLYRRWYWYDRRKKIETQLRLELMDEEMFREAADKLLRERGIQP